MAQNQTGNQSPVEVNAFALRGIVIEKDEGKIVLRTKAVSRDREYESDHTIFVGESTDVVKRIGKYATVHGHFETISVDDSKVTVLQADKVMPAKAGDGFLNVGQFTGQLARTYEFYGSKPGKQAFGNLLVRVGEFLGFATAWNYAAQIFRDCGRGSFVTVNGRIDYRERNGAIRLAADAEHSKVISAVKPENPLAGHPTVAAATEAAAGDDIPW